MWLEKSHVQERGTEMNSQGYTAVTLRLIEELAANHIDVSAILSRQHIDLNELKSGATQVSSLRYARLVRTVLAMPDAPQGLGLRVGRRCSIDDLGDAGGAMRGSRNLRYALCIAASCNPAPLGDPMEKEGSKLRFVGNEDGASLHRSCESMLWLEERFMVEVWLGSMCNIVDSLLPADCEYSESVRVRVTFPQPSYYEQYDELLAWEISFDESCNEILLPDELLDTPFLTADPSAVRNHIAMCQRDFDSCARSYQVIQRIHNRYKNESLGDLQLDEVANQLAVSTRTLNRRLAGAATNFREITTELRMNQAGEYLANTDLPAKHISYLLGYSHPESFYRAFREWWAWTPRQFRTMSYSSRVQSSNSVNLMMQVKEMNEAHASAA